MLSSDGITLDGFIAINSGQDWTNAGGIKVSSNNNSIVSNNVMNNYEGILLKNSSNNTLSNNNASSNNCFGFYLDSSNNNKISNNIFNNINNFYMPTLDYSNYWNITKASEINIVGGPYLGGNFWANPGGTGFSQTCTDSNKDGICNSNYTLTSGNIDYLPLAAIPAGYGFISGTVFNGTGIPGVTVTTNTSNSTITDASGFYYLFVPAGAYDLTATSEPRFYTNSSIVVTAISGTTVAQDIELIRKPTGNVTGSVTGN